MDYGKAIDEMQSKGDFLKITAGKHKIKFLSEALANTVTSEPVNCPRSLPIKAICPHKEFSVTPLFISQTYSCPLYSTLNCILFLGVSLSNVFSNSTGSGKDIVYTVEEALDLMELRAKEKQKPTEEVVN